MSALVVFFATLERIRVILEKILGVCLLTAIIAILNGYVLSVLWGWFMAPIFGLPNLSIVSAIGVTIVIGYITKQPDNYVEEWWLNFDENIATGAINAIVAPLFALFFGWVVHSFT